MIDDEGIRKAICKIAADPRNTDLNERGSAHYEGILRGLLWCLQGKDPGRFEIWNGGDWKRFFDQAGIPNQIEGDRVRFDLNDQYLGSSRSG